MRRPGAAKRRYIIKTIQSVGEIARIAVRRPLQKSPCPFKTGHLERWPSGLRRTLGKRVCGKPYRGFESHSLRHLILKYKVNLCFSMVDPRIASGRVRVWKASVILSEIRSRAELNCACLCFCTLPTDEIP